MCLVREWLGDGALIKETLAICIIANNIDNNATTRHRSRLELSEDLANMLPRLTDQHL